MICLLPSGAFSRQLNLNLFPMYLYNFHVVLFLGAYSIVAGPISLHIGVSCLQKGLRHV